MAGVYSYLPLGLRVLKKIEHIIREEMNAIGGQEVLLTTLQDPEIWKKSGRWDDTVVDNWFKSELKNGQEIGIANTHEEPLAHLLTQYASSYKDFPMYVYQFQAKFRNELRAKSGIMRAREFLMKDMYSFNRSQEELDAFYEKAIQAYKNVFQRVGIGSATYLTFASGGMFSKFSHEFQTVCDAGEDRIYIDDNKKMAVNDEVMQDDILQNLGIKRETLREAKSIEVGNIFKYGTRYTKELGVTYKDEKGVEQPVIFGAYGIGLGRLMGTIVELMADAKGIVWPKAVAPALVHLLALEGGEQKAEELYKDLQSKGVEVLYDDRQDSTPGQKFTDADLIGIPLRIVVSAKTLSAKKVEVKKRNEKQEHLIDEKEIIEYIQSL